MSASLLEIFRAGPPAPKVVLLPDAHFFVRVVPVTDAVTPDEVAAQVALALERLAPFPVEHLNHGFYWVPGAAQALVFAAYRRRFPAGQVESWAGAELVMPTFVALVGLTPEPATTVLVPGPDQLTAIHWGDAPVPTQVLVRALPPEATDEDRARARDELLREIGGSKKIVDLPAAPVAAPSSDEKEYLFQAGNLALHLPAAQAQWLDVRDKDELVALRHDRARDVLLWRIFLGCAATLLLLFVGEFSLVGGRMWQKSRIAQVNAQRPGVEKTTALNKLADRIEEFSTKRLLPFEMIKLLRAKLPPSVAFTRFTTGTTAETMDGGLYQVVAEAQTNNAADVATYQSALEGDKAVFDRVVVDNHGLRNGLTTFKLTVTFKPEALKPLPDQ
jgi:hypothetical protein